MSESFNTKTKAVLNHLQTQGRISTMTAIYEYGATRLSAIIFNLRKRYDITTEYQTITDRNGHPCRYADYIYNGELPKEMQKEE